MNVANPEAAALVLVEEFAHRVLNEYTQAIAGLKLAARRASDDVTRRQLTAAADQLFAHACAHRALAMPAPDPRCDVGNYIARVCAAVAQSLLPDTGLRLKLETSEAALSSGRCWRLALIVSELIHNAARHGDRTCEVLVELSADDRELYCCVSNSGGCSAAPSFGRGRVIVLALAEDLGGRADWLFTPTGACVWVVIPISRSAALDLQ